MNFKNSNRLTDLENKPGGWGTGEGEGTLREFRMQMHTLLHLTRTANQDLL